MCHHFSITFSYILYVFLFCFLWRRQDRNQGRLASDKKLIFKRSLAFLKLIFVPNFCWNTLLMWLQKSHKIAQNQNNFIEGGLHPPPPNANPRADYGRFARQAVSGPPKKNLKWRLWFKYVGTQDRAVKLYPGWEPVVFGWWQSIKNAHLL